AVDEAYRHGCDFKNLALKLLEYSRGLTLLKVDRNSADLLNLTETEAESLADAAGRHSLETLHRNFEAWLKFQGEAGFSPQPRWLLEAQVIRLASRPALVSLADLAARLERLLGRNPPPRAPMAPPPAPTIPAQTDPAPSAAPLKPPPAAIPAASSESPPMDWPGFLRRFARELGGSTGLLKGAQARKWGPEIVEITLSPGAGETAVRHLLAALPPLLEKVWDGRRPELIIDGGQDPGILQALKAAPDLQALQAALPGEFIEFRPGESAVTTEDDEEGETLAEEPADD
ncbi:MAG: hypothetical protein LBC90_05660, partial [Candidatus Adiutrix sp.]|nr:hypothetical protein [Candidatus Adiutrix sp.]